VLVVVAKQGHEVEGLQGDPADALSVGENVVMSQKHRHEATRAAQQLARYHSLGLKLTQHQLN
jgi:hypothetical protein